MTKREAEAAVAAYMRDALVDLRQAMESRGGVVAGEDVQGFLREWCDQNGDDRVIATWDSREENGDICPDCAADDGHS